MASPSDSKVISPPSTSPFDEKINAFASSSFSLSAIVTVFAVTLLHDPAPSPSEVHTWPLVPAEGIKYSNSDYHTPIDSEGEDWVYVSRLRTDIYKNNIFNLWVFADNLLKGAALNSVQIGESLIKKKIVSTNE